MEEEVAEVDTVISTHEILDLLKKLNGNEMEFFGKEEFREEKKMILMGRIENLLRDWVNEQENDKGKFEVKEKEKEEEEEKEKEIHFRINSKEDGTSNSYLYHIMRYFSKKMLKNEKNPEISIKQGKNSDLIVKKRLILLKNKLFNQGIYIENQ